MSHRVARVILLVLAAAAAGGAAYGVLTLERQAVADEARTQIGRDQTMAALSLVAEVRAAQRGYVAIGQTHEYWTARVTDLLVDLESQMRRVRETIRSDTARAAVDSAVVAVENLGELDARAQEYVSLDQPFLASDLIFSDGLDTTNAATTSLQAALRDETQAQEAAQQRLRQRQALATGGGGAALLLVSLLLFPVQTARDDGVVEPAAGDEPGDDEESATLVVHRIGDDPPGRIGRHGDDDLAPTGPGGGDASPAAGEPLPDLAGAARLCTELGRVTETGELPPLLERAARLLDAAGLVVWVTDQTGTELRPVLTHGYADKVVAQMHGISADAQNAAALAFRSAESRVVGATDLANGAVVVPLITPAGCVGVFAAELRQGAERREHTRALATILAAQVAMLVGPAQAPGAAHAHA